MFKPPSPIYLTQKTTHTLTHWWFSMWRTHLPHPNDWALPLMHQPINLHLPTPCPKYTVVIILAYRHPLYGAPPLPLPLLQSPFIQPSILSWSFQPYALPLYTSTLFLTLCPIPLFPSPPIQLPLLLPSPILPITLCSEVCCYNPYFPYYQSVPRTLLLIPLGYHYTPLWTPTIQPLHLHSPQPIAPTTLPPDLLQHLCNPVPFLLEFPILQHIVCQVFVSIPTSPTPMHTPPHSPLIQVKIPVPYPCLHP